MKSRTDEIDKFFDSHKLPKLIQIKINNTNGYIITTWVL